MDGIEKNPDEIPSDMALTNISLPNKWTLYLYEKQLFKKMADRPNFKATPCKELCTIGTVNDLIYILQLMEVKTEPKIKLGPITSNKINLDANDYIIMRKGIEPIWEDPKNSNGGTFTIKMNHIRGYDVWSTFVMYMLGETMTYEMDNINGITVSYIPDTNCPRGQLSSPGDSYTYIKIWDGKPNRTKEQFINILPLDLYEKVKNESLMYSQNNKKEDFGKKSIVNKFNSVRRNTHNTRERGGFKNKRF